MLRGFAGLTLSVPFRIRAVELKAATTQIEDAACCGAAPDLFWQGVKMSAAVFLDLQQTRLAKDAEMLRDVVLGYTEPPANFVDVERCVDQKADDPDPGVLAERAKRNDAIVPFEHRQ